MCPRLIEAEYILNDEPTLDPSEPTVRLDFIVDIRLSEDAHPLGVLQSGPSLDRIDAELPEKLVILSE